MLLVLLVTALSASAGLSADSVRAAAKSGAVRPDTTLKAPTVAVPTVPAPEIVLPSLPGASATQSPAQTVGAPSEQPAAKPAAPASSAPANVVVQQAASPTAVVSTALLDAKPTAPPVAQALLAASATSVAASPTSAKDSAAKVVVAPAAAAKAEPAPTSPASAPATVVASTTGVAKEAKVVTTSDSKPAPDVKQVAESKRAAEIKPPVVAPADVVAASPRSAASTTRVDPRTVVSVKSSERFEPLYAVPLPSARLRLGAPAAADSIVVYKRERTLVLFNRGVPVRTYFVALGSKPVGDKVQVGDQRTPEGLFYVNAHNPASKFHLALRISYPDDAHRARAASLGVDPGGDIMIHGLPKEYSEAGTNHLQNDWTNGCVALSNQEIEEIWRTVPDGTPVQIKP
jgi:lipoprotein-anchoring transpeptidase ErfK/SrfK